MIWFCPHSLKYMDSGLLLLFIQVAISDKASQISIITYLIECLHMEYYTITSFWNKHSYIAFNDVKF